MENNFYQFLSELISSCLDETVELSACRQVSGGDINTSFRVSSECGQRFFVKKNSVNQHDLLFCELTSLNIIAQTQAIKTPKPIALDDFEDCSFLVMEWLPLAEPRKQGIANEALLGHQLATLHQNLSESFGWQHDNYIGYTPQINMHINSWCDFWIENRFAPQWQRAMNTGLVDGLASLEQPIIQATENLLASHKPQPSLLHGDLWSGNKGFTSEGPVIFDPASYYGDRETDLAFTQMFGGFTEQFYESYADCWPLDRGHQSRVKLYNFYHQLNHLNLFGGSYASGCGSMAREIIVAADG